MTALTVPQRTSSGRLHREPLLLEIQAMRALAVVLVVVYHVWPARLPGGFIGVDVFFVISGFLITAHLLREQAAEGRIRVAAFWARRIRRLLPAAFVVLGVCAIVSFVLLPEVVRLDTLRQIAAAGLYGLNWVLAIDAVDYLAAGDTATVVQHYWTLSVEEQFYVLWPLLLVLAGAVFTRFGRRRASSSGAPRRTLVLAAVVVVLSLAYSVVFTWLNPAFAYFSTFTRAWEFAAGALLAAFAVVMPAAWERIRDSVVGVGTGILSIAGVVLIVVAAFVLDGDVPFPGILAILPVAGTLLLILGGMPHPRVLAVPIAWRPVQFLGDVSYSLYLWHWPLIMGFVLLLGRRPSVAEGLTIIAASILLAAVTKVLVEDPARRSRLLSRLVAAFALAGLGAAVFLAGYLATREAERQQALAEVAAVAAAVGDTSGCYGANAVLGEGDCPDPYLLGSDVDLTDAANDLAYQEWCLTWFDEEWASCEFGDLTARNGTLALVGDSHAASMVEAFDEYFAEAGWKVVTFTRFGCSGFNLGLAGESDLTEQGRKEFACRVWSERVRDELVARDDITDVVYLNYTSSYLNRAPEYVLTEDDIVANLELMVDAGKRVVVVKDWPRTDGDSIPVCLASRVGEIGPCSTDRAVSMPDDPQDAAVARVPGVREVDLTNAYCDENRCYSVVGGVVVYADHNHISGRYSRSLMPYLGPLILAR